MDMLRTLSLAALLAAAGWAQCAIPDSILPLTREQVRWRVAAGYKDFFLYKRLLDLTPLRPKPGTLARDFKALLDANADDARFHYLYGRALMGKNTPEAIQHLHRAAKLNPKLPWTHLALAEIYASPNFRDDTELTAAIESFRKLCPESLESFRYLDRIKEPAAAAQWAAQLRPLLERSPKTEDARYWQLLWGAEFRSVPEADYAPLRKRVAADLQRIEPLTRTPALNYTISEGYRLSGQTELAAKLASELDNGDRIVSNENRAWEKTKTMLWTRDATSRQEREAFMRERAALAAEWVRKYPNSRFAWTLRLSSLPFTTDWRKEDLERAGDRILELDREYDFGWNTNHEPLRVAQVWVRFGVRLKDSLRMSEQALAHILEGPEEPNDLTADANTVRAMTGNRYGFDAATWDAMGAVVDAAVQLGELDKARGMLARMRDWLRQNAGRETEPGSGYQSFRNQYLTHAGRIAQAEGRKLDALAHYASAIATGWVRDDIVDRAQALWKEQGGSQEAWHVLTARAAPPRTAAAQAPATPPDFFRLEKLEKPLPSFTLRDTYGKVWTPNDLKGKRTLVNVWATWCGPCRDEFPPLQKLSESIKDRDDVQLISLNVDQENPGLVAPFLAEYEITFPVLLDARKYVTDFIGFLGIPQTWLVDRNGILRAKSHGFDPSMKDWSARILKELEQLP